MTGSPSNPSDELIFAPAGISHLTGDNADLVRSAAAGRSQLRMTTAAQLNGVPHLGTVVTMLTVFAFAAHCSEVLDLPALIVFDALENAPAEHLEFDGEVYTRSVGDLIDTGQIDSRERTAGFEQLLAWAQRRSGISYEFRPYSVYQSLRPVRECLHQIASRPMDFAPIVAPRDRIIRIRPRCPSCPLHAEIRPGSAHHRPAGAPAIGRGAPAGQYRHMVAFSGIGTQLNSGQNRR